jgi:hypothetical protein
MLDWAGAVQHFFIGFAAMSLQAHVDMQAEQG